jgi:DMSO/TMAO reductase YedYZ molybdopterin-dependent catalytic subunit
MSRRGFIAAVGSGGAAALVSGLGPVFAAQEPGGGLLTPAGKRLHVKPLPEPFFIMHGTNAEMNWLQKQNDQRYLMDSGQFFIRNHSATPIIDPSQWQLQIDGPGVANPMQLSYAELLKMPGKTVTRFVECAGNARSLYNEIMGKPAQGTQWGTGGFGIAEWTGVPLADVLDKAGLKKSAVSIMASGLDESGFKKPLPIGKALADDTLLVTAMNGAPLPYDHGFPVRLLVPGWIGSYNVKWLGSLHVGEEQLYSKWNTSSYVLKGEGYPDPEGPVEGVIIREQTVKSVLALPRPASLPAGRQTLRGYAWSPYGPIDKVEVSLDEGKSYQPARLLGPNIGAAGVRWEFEIDAKPGMMIITPRATDAKGHRQIAIAEQKYNKQGFIWEAVIPHPVTFVG